MQNLVVPPSHRQRSDLVAAQVEPITEPSATHLKIFVEHRDELRGSMEFVVALGMANCVYFKKSCPEAGIRAGIDTMTDPGIPQGPNQHLDDIDAGASSRARHADGADLLAHCKANRLQLHVRSRRRQGCQKHWRRGYESVLGLKQRTRQQENVRG